MARYRAPQSADDAIEIALRISQLPRERRPRTSRVSLAGDRTPFLGKRIAALGQAWHVRLTAVRWALPSSIPGYSDSYARDVTVVIAERTGQLIRIDAVAGVKDPDMRSLPLGEEAERQLRSTREEYIALPDEEPRIGFVDALDAVLSHGIGSPFQAKAVHAVYVQQTKMDSKPRNVWAITLRGLPPIPPELPKGAEPPPAWQLNFMRNIVDAETGQVLFATSIPVPE